MSVEAWVQGNRPGGSGRSPGEKENYEKQSKLYDPGY